MTTAPHHPGAIARRDRPDVAGTRLVAFGGAGGLVVAAMLSPRTIGDGPVICPFRRLTGLPCPGCGLTRSWVYGMHGWWRQSLEANPFGVVLAVGVVLLAVAIVVARVRRRTEPSVTAVTSTRPVRLVALAWVGFGVVRAVVDLAS